MIEKSELLPGLIREYQNSAPKVLGQLMRIFGAQHLQFAEDCLQDTFEKALINWSLKGLPENPSAWLSLTAKNKALDILRHAKRNQQLEDLNPIFKSEWTLEHSIDDALNKNDNIELELLFWLASSELEHANIMPVMLKYMCSLTDESIAKVLLCSRETIKKRIQRARTKLAEKTYKKGLDHVDKASVYAVQLSLYLLFSHTTAPDSKQDENNLVLLLQCLGLCKQLLELPQLVNSDSFALYALMHFHHARHQARKTDGYLALELDEQDRKRWSKPMIIEGAKHLNQAIELSDGKQNRFLLEALIAYEHCRASSFEETHWATIADYYRKLYRVTQSPLFLSGLSISLGFNGQAKEGLSVIRERLDAKQVKKSKHIQASIAFLYALTGDKKAAMSALHNSINLGLNKKEAAKLKHRISRLC